MNSDKQNKDKINEQVFKNMVMTFSIEGVTKDIQDILQKKMNYHTRVLKELSGVINSIALSKDKSLKDTLLKSSNVSSFIKETYEEYKLIIGCTNILLNNLMRKKSFLDKSYDPIEEEDY